MYNEILIVGFGTCLGNIIFQLFRKQANWGEAIERTFFQWSALGMLALIITL